MPLKAVKILENVLEDVWGNKKELANRSWDVIKQDPVAFEAVVVTGQEIMKEVDKKLRMMAIEEAKKKAEDNGESMTFNSILRRLLGGDNMGDGPI